ncbi:DUF2161 domain-containing phosphodiesterase [Paenibacillus abyssi]|uniref:Uncharacterized protein n=1 Tax=Paenibacillus abyssi TaxID=1340531 RepID=A0A917FPD4_9BACL|nr:DUF2161 family putative PD-(D/E)XK-type phosphodiesterase [Paenibacillus abyssi]GGF97340.1 hypothetical protein GCM10010916_13230 [Paenibacillus abyssi]
MAVKQEAELYGPVKSFFEQRGYEVKSEIMHCDLVAIKPDGEMLIVEMKKTFNLALLLQGVERLRICDYVVLAVERNRKKSGSHNQRFGDLAELCRMVGLGLMTITFFKTKAPLIEMLCEPGELPRKLRRPTRQSRMIQEFKERSGDYNVGGITGHKLVTAYREKALHCACALQEHGQLAPRQVAQLTGNKRAAELLRNDYYGWFERVERGVYRLREAGVDALITYADIVNGWQAKKGVSQSREIY